MYAIINSGIGGTYRKMERSQLKGVTPKMGGRKLNYVYWQGALKYKGVKQGLLVIVGSPVWKLWRFTILSSMILRWLLYFWKICDLTVKEPRSAFETTQGTLFRCLQIDVFFFFLGKK
jgi:hypothetical protein